jgi:hypothetical protein
MNLPSSAPTLTWAELNGSPETEGRCMISFGRQEGNAAYIGDGVTVTGALNTNDSA